MIYVEPAPTNKRLADLFRVGGLYYFRVRSARAREALRARIENYARIADIPVKCQGVHVATNYMPVLKVSINMSNIPLPAYGREQVQNDDPTTSV